MESSFPTSKSTVSPANRGTIAEIESQLDRLVQLADGDVPLAKFQTELLGCVVSGLGVRRGAIWSADHRPGEPPVASIDAVSTAEFSQSEPVFLASGLNSHMGHELLLRRVILERKPLAALPGLRDSESEQVLNPTRSTLLLAPIVSPDSPPDAVIEVVLGEAESPATRAALLELLAAFADAARVYFDRKRLAALRQRDARRAEWDRFMEKLHATLDPESVAFTAANEGRAIVHCDRISVVSERRGRSRLLATSGQSTLDRRSPVVSAIEELVNAVAAGREPVWYPSPPETLPPEIASLSGALCELTNARRILIWPLRHALSATDQFQTESAGADRDPAKRQDSLTSVAAGAILFEHWTAGETEPRSAEPYAALVRHTALALANCRRHENLPFFSIVSWIGSWQLRRNLSRIRLGAIAVLCALALLWLIPTELKVSGKGTLQPEVRRDLFARTDGVVESIEAEHETHCRTNDVLLRLSRSQLDLEQTRVAGELRTARRRLAGLEAARLQSDPQTAADREKSNQSTAEEEELRETVAGLERQSRLLEEQADELIVRAPIAGDVLTWDVRETLASRPVQRGQLLLTVGDLTGPWILEVDIPDEAIGHVLTAQSRSNSPLPVTFMLATDPGTTYTGELERLAMSAEPDRVAGQRVRAIVRIPELPAHLRRPGAVVIPRVHCGKFPVGYVWFHTAWENAQKYLLF
ncbi:MAG: HlyD family efflux transporter periplasmic adaptor subunit [Planctomycetota bacterium]|nr:HlyD family efflux transporter periplasmic adaptor subunit [Planctomycetota bacterium]